jgi:hypothetical protein
MEICAVDLNMQLMKNFYKGNLTSKSPKLNAKRVRILNCGTLNDGASL